MNKALNPAHIAPPYKNRYSHAKATTLAENYVGLPLD